MNEPRLSIVIPTWNRRDLVVACLDSIAAQNIGDCEIIVVDDGGTDDTADIVERDYPAVTLVRRPVNGGFARAVNAGITSARGPLVMLLNNDITVAPGALQTLLAVMNDQPAVDIAGPLMLMAEDPNRVYAAGDRQRVNGTPESIGFRLPLSEVDFSETPFGITAGAAVYRRQVFERIGLFDERFVAYFEDGDLNFRAQLAGMRCTLVREAIVYHAGGASIANRTWWRTRQCYRNHLLLVLKNMPGPQLLRHGPKIMAERFRGVARLFSAARCHRGAVFATVQVFLAVVEAWSLIPYALRARKAVRRLRKVSPAQLETKLHR